MKEAFWGTLIIILGLFGIVVINVFQNVTVDNDRVYYLIKESTQAAALDALDLTYYRLNGDYRIVEDKFVENLTRRFAENVTIGDYTIIVEDINEMPPKVSLRVRSGVTSLNGEEFGILNRVDGIIEAKYSLDEVLDFLGITEEEWNLRIKVDPNDNTCNVVDIDEPVCIPGDLKFVDFSDSSVKTLICHDETPSNNVSRVANYKECVCGKWEDKTQTVTANPIRNGNDYIYTWTFTKASNVRTISESIKERVKVQVCTTAIQEMVPSDIQDKKPTGSTYEPSSDNSSYIVCPPGGIRIIQGMNFVMHPNYIPPNSVNRNLTWSVSDSNVLGIQASNPSQTCVLNSSNSNCFSKAIITAKNIGTAYVNVKTTRNQTASCLVNVVSGYVDNLSCNDLVLETDKTGTMQVNYTPSYAVYKDFKWSISDSSIATINENNGKVTAVKPGTTTVTISAAGNKSATCKLTVNLPQYPDPICQDLSLAHNGSETVKYSYSPSNAMNATFKFSISNTSVATIDTNTGKVTAKGAGTATITMTGESGKTTTCKVTVNAPPVVSPPTTDTGGCSVSYNEHTTHEPGSVVVPCNPTQFLACNACGAKTCKTSACGYATCKSSSCGYATCKSSACGYASCATSACGYATCQSSSCGRECTKRNWLGICKEYGGYKTCKSSSCGYATCKNSACGYASCATSACGYATCKSSACGYASCTNSACGYNACYMCGTKTCYANGEKDVYETVTYYGYKNSEVTSGSCSGGVKKVTVATYCVFSRTRYVHNPGVEGKKLISTYTYDSYC